MSDHVRDWSTERLSTAFLTSYSPRLSGQVNREREAYQALHEARTRIAELEANNDGLYAEVKMYGAANGELKDALDAMTAAADILSALEKSSYSRAEQAEAILLGEDVTVAAYRDVQADLAALKAESERWRWALRAAYRDYLDDNVDEACMTLERYEYLQLESGDFMRAEEWGE